LKRICASSWTIAKNHCTMHGQQNVKNVMLSVGTAIRFTQNCSTSIV